MSLKFRYTILYVDDVPATLAFYELAFGARTQMLHEGRDYGELSTGGTTLAFSSRTLLRQLGKSPEAPMPGRPTFELTFQTTDVDDLFRRACDAGAKPIQEPRRESVKSPAEDVGAHGNTGSQAPANVHAPCPKRDTPGTFV